MSEYQYYEFVAVDGPISDAGMRYAEGCSSRAEVSRMRWRNVYHFGDFGGKVEKLLKYYDAHFYIANWGSVRFGLVVPKNSLDPAAIESYIIASEFLAYFLAQDAFRNYLAGNVSGVGGSLMRVRPAVDELIVIREEIMRGDYRALFLGWLADFYPDEWTNPKDTGVLVPPVPGGLDRLSPAQTALIEHFPVDRDTLAVATSLSQAFTSERIPMATVVQRLSVSEMQALLERVAGGEGSRVMAELNRLATPPRAVAGVSTLSCVDFAAKVRAVRDARLEAEAGAAAAKRKREAEARRQRMASVMERADAIWAGLDPLMDQKVMAAYDQVAAQLKELSDAHEQAGESARFQQKLTAFRERYARRPAMMRRMPRCPGVDTAAPSRPNT